MRESEVLILLYFAYNIIEDYFVLMPFALENHLILIDKMTKTIIWVFFSIIYILHIWKIRRNFAA